MTPKRWDYTTGYLREVFGQEPAELRALQREAKVAGLPDISISPDVGRLLQLLLRSTDAKLAIEIGTLGGYSSIWIARALADDGKLITIEREPVYAAFAERQFAKLGLEGRIDVRRGSAIDVLSTLVDELPSASVDAIFMDALKHEYPEYWRIVSPLLKPGGLLIADNALGTSEWWIDDESHPDRVGADQLNRALAHDPDFDAVAVPLREGLLLARRLR